MRRVLVLNHFAAPAGAAGGTRHVELFGHLRGWQATILAADRNMFTSRRTRSSDGIWRPLRTTPVGRGQASRVASWLSYAVAVLLVAGRRRERPDVIYASSPHLLAGLSGWVLARVRHASFILEVRDLWPLVLLETGTLRAQGPAYRLLSRLEEFLYAHADAIVALTHGVEAAIASHGIPAHRIRVIPNGADPGYFTAPAPRDELRVRFDLEGFVVAYTGAHGIANGLDLVLDAANTIRSEPCDIKLLLVGDGPLKASLQRRAGAEGLTNVVFRPAIPKSEMPALLGAVDAGLHCLADLPMFRYGVSPNKLFDYLAAGLPVLTNTQGEVADIVVACGAGVAVAPHDIAGGIRQLWQADPEQRAAWGRAGRDCVRLNYDRNKLADQLEALLDEMAPPPGRGSAPT